MIRFRASGLSSSWPIVACEYWDQAKRTLNWASERLRRCGRYAEAMNAPADEVDQLTRSGTEVQVRAIAATASSMSGTR
ncbi:MAG: hypothetical protein K0Q71_5809, partial [Thermomicrobiales bacterium]|nr:hypothetical protein [Thermomicrobiales bacterium]